MIAVTDADRKAAEELRVLLAGLSGFWHRPDDDGPLCIAMAKHREMCELQLLEKISSTKGRPPVADIPCTTMPAKARMAPRPSALA